MDEMIFAHTPDNPAYHQKESETDTEYELFVQWCQLPAAGRNINNFCRRTGISHRLAKKVHDKNRWDARSLIFDQDSRNLMPDPTVIDEDESLAAQMAAGVILLDLGMQAMATKNPSMISVGDAIKVINAGVEIQRKVMGMSDLNVEFSGEDMSRVQKLLEAASATKPETVDVEVLEEEDDDNSA